MAEISGYKRRFVDDRLDELMPYLPAFIITGPRACGKSTTAERRANSVFNFDDPSQREAFRSAPDFVLSQQRPPVLLDEWQDAPESLAAVKRAVDRDSSPGRFLITGSARSRLMRQGWPLTGRATPLSMWPMTMAEQVGRVERGHWFSELVASADLTSFGPQEPVGLPDYLESLVTGGFPQTLSLPKAARNAWFAGYVEQLVQRDVPEVADIRSPSSLLKLLNALALNSAGTPTLSSLSEFAGLNYPILIAYLSLLEDLRLIHRVPAWSTNRLTRLIKSPKYYLTDVGLATYLIDVDSAGLLRDGNLLGRLLDTFVMAQLRPMLELDDARPTVHHLRTSNGTHEVDILIETADGRCIGIEVKTAASANKHDARHLEWLRDSLGDAFIRGVVLHTGTLTYPLGDRIWALPISSFWAN